MKRGTPRVYQSAAKNDKTAGDILGRILDFAALLESIKRDIQARLSYPFPS